jgi:hypothetical protein
VIGLHLAGSGAIKDHLDLPVALVAVFTVLVTVFILSF